MSKHYKKVALRPLRQAQCPAQGTKEITTEAQRHGEELSKKRGGKGRGEEVRGCVVCGSGAMRCVEPPLCEKHLEMVSLISQAERLNARRATFKDVLDMAVLVRGKMVLTRRELADVYRDVMCNYWEKEN